MDIVKLVQDLKNQGLDDNKILVALQQMMQEGRIQAEDLEKAKAMLSSGQEKAQAEKLFDLKFNNNNKIGG